MTHQLAKFYGMALCSEPFTIRQGVQQGGTLFPFLYCIFVDELTISGFGATIHTVYCAAPMYADDLSLVTDSPESLQAMHIVHQYTLELSRWRWSLGKLPTQGG